MVGWCGPSGRWRVQSSEEMFHLLQHPHVTAAIIILYLYLIQDSTFEYLHSLHCSLYRTKGSEINRSRGAKIPFKVHLKRVKLKMKVWGERGGKIVISAPFAFHPVHIVLVVLSNVHTWVWWLPPPPKPGEPFQLHAGSQKWSRFFNQKTSRMKREEMLAAARQNKQLV